MIDRRGSLTMVVVAVSLLLTHAAGVRGQTYPLAEEACRRLRSAGSGQVFGPTEDLRRLVELAGEAPTRPITVRRASDPLPASGCLGEGAEPLVDIGPVRLYAATVRASSWYNDGYPDDRDNGFVWTGRGVTTAVSAGIHAQAGPIRAGLLPAVAWQQNDRYEIRPANRPGFPEYANPYYTGIDLPQRMGTAAFWSTDWLGQSYVRADAWGFGVGLSHENFLIGPSVRNPILMSATASGFTHLFAGTTRPVDLRFFRVNAQLVVGRLEESEHFDQVAENDENGIALWTLAISPGPLRDLEIGVARVYMTRRVDETFDFGGLAEVLAFGSESNLPGNEIASLFARWVFPEAGAEVYGEWARDDRYAGFGEDLIPEPDHSQAYSIGLQTLTPVAGGSVRVLAELNHLQEKQEPRAGRPLPVYYTHHIIRQGYTHQGQMLGAGVGPGADAQFVGFDWMDDWGYAGLYVERVRRNDGSRVAIDARWNWPYEHDTELTLGTRGLFLWQGFSAAAELSWSRRYYRDFIEKLDTNVAFRLELSAWPAALARTP